MVTYRAPGHASRLRNGSRTRDPVPAPVTILILEVVNTDSAWTFAPDQSFVDQLRGLYTEWSPDPVPAPRLLFLNEALATELGLDPDELRRPAGVEALVGLRIPAGVTTVAQAYAGHQFGGYSPRLGDGRAVLLGEVVDVAGRRRDIHLKGSGRTPFARGGDGKAAVGPMLRELILGEAMHALGIPTTRALAVVATGETVARDVALPGAVLCRVAASHLRVGTFEFAAASGDLDLLRRLLQHAIHRHHPEAADDERPALSFLEAVVDVQASTVARWMAVGFVHGVMNTDNTTISGETIDYGPCAFMEAYDPATTFSSIDHGGRYAYGNQPAVTAWNLARLAETLLPLIDDDTDAAVAAATEVVEGFAGSFEKAHRAAMAAKVGMAGEGDDTVVHRSVPHRSDPVVAELLELMGVHRVDFTSGFRALSGAARGEVDDLRRMFDHDERFERWLSDWLDSLGAGRQEAAERMDAVNPVHIPRNHLVEEALAAATAGDLDPVHRLLEVLADPYRAEPGQERYAQAAPAGLGRYVTYCGT